jgi:hypothetical protein
MSTTESQLSRSYKNQKQQLDTPAYKVRATHGGDSHGVVVRQKNFAYTQWTRNMSWILQLFPDSKLITSTSDSEMWIIDDPRRTLKHRTIRYEAQGSFWNLYKRDSEISTTERQSLACESMPKFVQEALIVIWYLSTLKISVLNRPPEAPVRYSLRLSDLKSKPFLSY